MRHKLQILTCYYFFQGDIGEPGTPGQNGRPGPRGTPGKMVRVTLYFY